MEMKEVETGKELMNRQIDEQLEKVENKYPKATGILTGNKGVEYKKNLHHKEDFHYCSIENVKEETDSKGNKVLKGKVVYDKLPDEKKPRKTGKKKSRSRVKSEQEKEDETSIKRIEYIESESCKEMGEHPYLKQQELIENFNIPLDDYNQAQLMKNIEWVTKYGKVANKQISNSKTVRSIGRLPVKTFGSAGQYDVDSLPSTLFKCKGTEVTEVNTDNYTNENTSILSRRFVSDILSYWSYVMGIRYVPDESKPDKPSGIGIWGKEVNYSGVKGEWKTKHFITGEDIKMMLKDIIFLTRNQKAKQIYKKIRSGIVSSYLYDTITSLRYVKKTTTNTILQRIKNRLYYDYQVSDIAWSFPKYNVNYLIELVNELNSGKYYNNILTPLIYEMHKYPIECKDTRVFPLTQQRHTDNYGDYDLQQYISERDSGGSGWYPDSKVVSLEEIVYCPKCNKKYRKEYYRCVNCGSKTKFIDSDKEVKSW